MCAGNRLRVDHTEVVEVNYNKRIISLSDILRVFFENHDYTMPLPKRYASSIFFTESSQYDEAASFMRTRLVAAGKRLDSRAIQPSRVCRRWSPTTTPSTCFTSTTSRTRPR